MRATLSRYVGGEKSLSILVDAGDGRSRASLVTIYYDDVTVAEAKAARALAREIVALLNKTKPKVRR